MTIKSHLNDASGVIAAGGTAQQVVGADDSRDYLLFQNQGATVMWIDFGATAVAAAPSIQLPAGAAIVFEDQFQPSTYVSVMCGVTGAAYCCKTG